MRAYKAVHLLLDHVQSCQGLSSLVGSRRRGSRVSLPGAVPPVLRCSLGIIQLLLRRGGGRRQRWLLPLLLRTFFLRRPGTGTGPRPRVSIPFWGGGSGTSLLFLVPFSRRGGARVGVRFASPFPVSGIGTGPGAGTGIGTRVRASFASRRTAARPASSPVATTTTTTTATATATATAVVTGPAEKQQKSREVMSGDTRCENRMGRVYTKFTL